MTAAANACHVTSSALALSLDELERHLGVQLLVRRKGRGVSLTPAGSRMLTRARDVLAQAGALAEAATQDAAELSGPFSIGCFTTLTPFFLPQIVDRFQRKHPAVELDVVTGAAEELHEHLLQGRIDAALLYSVDVPRSLVFDPVLAYRPHVLVPAAHRLADAGEISLAELADEPLVLLDVAPAGNNTRTIFDRLGLEPRIAHVTSSFEAVRCLVGSGLGYAVMFQRPATSTTYDGHEVRVVEIADRVPRTVVGLARPHGAIETSRSTALRTFVAETRTGGAPLNRESGERSAAVTASGEGRR